MIVFGIILIIVGVILYINGNSTNNDFDSQMESIFNDGTVDPGDTFITLGVLCIAIGAIMLIIGIYRSYKEKNCEAGKCVTRTEEKFVVCEKCGKKNLPNASYCLGCGDNLLQQGKVTCRCPKCNRELPSDSKFCSFCGYDFSAEDMQIY